MEKINSGSRLLTYHIKGKENSKIILADEILFVNSLIILKARELIVCVAQQSEYFVVCIDNELNKELENEKHRTSN
jgi:aspartate 1-decarboxylase